MPEWYIPVAGNKMWWQVWGWISGSIIRRFECDLWKKRCLWNGGRKINMKIRILRRKTENSRHTEITIQEQEPENEISAEIIEIEKKKPKTSGCMKALGIICLIIFASAILDSCLFEWADKRAAAPWPDDEVKTKKRLALLHASPDNQIGGGGWIRTIEVSDSRFTVCPLWPLGNPTRVECLNGAGEGNRTLTISLEGWGSTIELHPQLRLHHGALIYWHYYKFQA